MNLNIIMIFKKQHYLVTIPVSTSIVKLVAVECEDDYIDHHVARTSSLSLCLSIYIVYDDVMYSMT